MTRQLIVCSLAGTCLVVATLAAAQPPATPPSAPQAVQDPAAALLKQGQQALRQGNHSEALTIFREVIAKVPPASPAASNAHVQAGVTLDLMGQYSEARSHFSKAIETAGAPEDKARAQRAMGMSYAFERDCAGAAKYHGPLYEGYVSAGDFFNAGEVANELARVCLESGNTDQAATWYRRGYEAGLKEPNLEPKRKDLWEFRWEHAQARLAARRGQAAEAQRHVTAAKAHFDKGTNPEQAQFLPYLVGYVAFYGGDYQAALTELQKGNQNDPFILSLIAQAHEKLGHKEEAAEYYRKVMASNGHGPTNAYARPLAKEKLGIK